MCGKRIKKKEEEEEEEEEEIRYKYNISQHTIFLQNCLQGRRERER